ncbi:MAG: hypothetical protein R3A47_00450 [Polyangiales bacterium]
MVTDATFAGKIKQMFEHDFATAHLMEADELQMKPWHFRFLVKLAHTSTSPIQ